MSITLEHEETGVTADVIEEEKKKAISPTRKKRPPKASWARCAARSRSR